MSISTLFFSSILWIPYLVFLGKKTDGEETGLGAGLHKSFFFFDDFMRSKSGKVRKGQVFAMERAVCSKNKWVLRIKFVQNLTTEKHRTIKTRKKKSVYLRCPNERKEGATLNTFYHRIAIRLDGDAAAADSWVNWHLDSH